MEEHERRPASRIAVVDDSPTIRAFIRAVLGRAGYRLIEFEDGLSAHAALVSDPPDLLICDLNLPGLDGMSLVRRLREELPVHFPAILLTGSSEHGDEALAGVSGFDDVLLKPVDIGVLRERVAAALGRERGA